MLATYCDICGEKIESPTLNEILKEAQEYHLILKNRGYEMDLCRECRKNLAAWLVEAHNKEVRKGNKTIEDLWKYDTEDQAIKNKAPDDFHKCFLCGVEKHISEMTTEKLETNPPQTIYRCNDCYKDPKKKPELN